MQVSIEWLPVVISALSTFLLGGIWYSLLFPKAWERLAGVKQEQLKQGQLRVFGGSFLLSLVMAASLAAFIGREGFAFGVLAGFATGATFVAAALGVNYLFERRSLGLYLINAGYNIVAFTIMGAIIGAMQS